MDLCPLMGRELPIYFGEKKVAGIFDAAILLYPRESYGDRNFT
jgi:hypothetical protein